MQHDEIKEENIETSNTDKPVLDYDFLHVNKNPNIEIITSQIDQAFNEANPVIKDYILSDEFESNIKLICKIEKLENEKAYTVVENITISILVGLLPINEAKSTLLESFISSNINIEAFAAGLILKNIDSYILSEVRKKILQTETNVKENRTVRHITLKDDEEEKEKEELRKILLERTGNLTGKGKVFVEYKNRQTISNDKEIINENKEMKPITINRDSLLAKISTNNISDIDKIKERMLQIKQEEESRIEKLEEVEKEKESIREKRALLEKEREQKIEEYDKENEKVEKETEEKEKENENISKIFAESLSEKLYNKEDEKVDLNRQRKEQEKVLNNKTTKDFESDIDPYRESF